MMIGRTPGSGGHVRRDRLIRETTYDPYKARRKLPEPTTCPDCTATYIDGRWRWLPEKTQAGHQRLCPACRRIQDKVPAGILTLRGEFLKGHHDEIARLIVNTARQQKAAHPLKRIMSIDAQNADHIVVSFTDMHLPRDIGQAVQNAYKGQLDINYADEASIIRADWYR